MLGGLNNNNQNGQGATCESYWRGMPVSYKGLILACLALGLLSIFIGIFAYIFANVVAWTLYKFQIWRLLTSFLVDNSIISVIFKLYMLNFSLPNIEKSYSTSFALLEIVVQTLLCNVFFIVSGQFFSLLGLANDQSLTSYGLIHLVFCFLWRETAQDPEGQTKFCFFPCLMPKKYLPWCFLAFFMLFGMELFTFTSCLLGYFQFMFLKRSIIELPLSFYNKLENLLPASVKSNPGFVSISSVGASLLGVSRKAAVQRESNNPYESNNNREDAMNDRVEVMGNGVSIGGSSQLQPSQSNSYKNHWLKEDNAEVQQKKQSVPDIIDLKEESEEEQSGRKLIDSHNQTQISDCPFQFTRNDESEQKI